MRAEPCPRHVLVGDYGKYYENTYSARGFLQLMPQVEFSHLEWDAYAWPGGYEICYVLNDGDLLCHSCANDNLLRTIDPDDDQFYIVDADVHWEGPPIYCDHCNREIESEYGDPDEPEAEDSEA